MLWKKKLTLDEMNKGCQDTAVSHLGITFTDIGDNYLEATTVISEACCQPMGYLHGGISATIAESVGSLAGYLACEAEIVVGTEINASHLLPVKKGETIVARATPLRVGKRQQVWDISLKNNEGALCCAARLSVAVVNK